METQEFREIVWNYARRHARIMPWRARHEPYDVLVSEIMLQQTQVSRVVPKFEAFMNRFPTVDSLAQAPLSEILIAWSGLGYNRRAKFLRQAAVQIKHEWRGVFPHTKEELMRLPGVGPNTAGAILAYAFNQPAVFIETNIRSVFFEHFFDGYEQVSDKQLYEKVEQTLDREHPREWYWALMDYGTHLKKNSGGRLAQSSHYKKQSPLAGSRREMRGRIIKALQGERLSEKKLRIRVFADERFEPALQALLVEQLIKKDKSSYALT